MTTIIHACSIIILGPVNRPGLHATRLCIQFPSLPWRHFLSLLTLWRAR